MRTERREGEGGTDLRGGERSDEWIGEKKVK
jgi:hypothetical protein